MPRFHYHIFQQVEDTLGAHQEWMERCGRAAEIRAGGRILEPDNIISACSGMDCFRDSGIPKHEVADWVSQTNTCQNAWESMRRNHPLIYDMWEMGNQGFDDCRQGIKILAETTVLVQDEHPDYYQAVLDHSDNLVFQSGDFFQPGQVDFRSKLWHRIERAIDPIGMETIKGEQQALILSNRQAALDALERCKQLEIRCREEKFHQAFGEQLLQLRLNMDQHIKQFETAHQVLQQVIDKAWNKQPTDMTSLNHQITRERQKRIRKQAEQDLERELIADQSFATVA